MQSFIVTGPPAKKGGLTIFCVAIRLCILRALLDNDGADGGAPRGVARGIQCVSCQERPEEKLEKPCAAVAPKEEALKPKVVGSEVGKNMFSVR